MFKVYIAIAIKREYLAYVSFASILILLINSLNFSSNKGCNSASICLFLIRLLNIISRCYIKLSLTLKLSSYCVIYFISIVNYSNIFLYLPFLLGYRNRLLA